MASPVHSYNPKKVTCALGNHIVTGFADDSMISVEYNGDGTSHVQGADGEIVRSIDPSTVYSVKITLQQTSETNEFLQRQYEEDKAYGSGMFNIIIKDLWGGDQFTAPNAWVVKPASFVRGKTQQNKEWELMCADGVISETRG